MRDMAKSLGAHRGTSGPCRAADFSFLDDDWTRIGVAIGKGSDEFRLALEQLADGYLKHPDAGATGRSCQARHKVASTRGFGRL